MRKYKICPVCHAKNLPSVLECTECGNDMMGVRIVDDVHIKPVIHIVESPEHVSEKSSADLVRVCDCGYENEVSVRKCVSCGEDISDIIPAPRRSNKVNSIYIVSSFDGVVSLRMECPSEHIIGREQELSSYLKPLLFVSRKHAKVTVTSEGVFIQNLSKANGTYINNEKIDDDIAYKLCVGDEIGLGGFVNDEGRQDMAAYFVVGRE